MAIQHLRPAGKHQAGDSAGFFRAGLRHFWLAIHIRAQLVIAVAWMPAGSRSQWQRISGSY